MDEKQPFKEDVPMIFTVEHGQDPRYVKLRLTDQWKKEYSQYNSVTFLSHSFAIPSAKYIAFGDLDKRSAEIHGPVWKREFKNQLINCESDSTGVFKYPQPWPEPAMEWLVRHRTGPWPTPDLIQEVFESGCHIAPVRRGKRHQEPIDPYKYHRDPIMASCQGSHDHDSQDVSSMDATEWRLSFSVAENKLGQSVTPVQRHIIVLLKMLKKLYFPGVISSYHLKNLLFWEIEKNKESFWKEDNSAKCLGHMLDRLERCLKDGCLPHYIVPESNLLEYEESCKLAEAVKVVCDVRRDIFSDTINMFRRIISLTYVSPFYLQNLDWESLFSKIDDVTLPLNGVKHLTCSLLELFISKCTSVIEGLLHSIVTEDLQDDVKKYMSVPLFAYKSLLARCLCKRFLLTNGISSNSQLERDENKFLEYAKEKASRFDSDDDVIALAKAYFEQALNGKDISEMIPNTSLMLRTKELHDMFGRKHVEKATASLLEEYGWLSSNDLEDISRRVVQSVVEGGSRIENLSIESLQEEMLNELNELKLHKQAEGQEKSTDRR